MKILPLTVLLMLAALPSTLWGQPSSQADFTTAVRSAIQEKSWPKIMALTYTAGMSEADKQQMELMKQVYFGGADIADISFEPLPPGFGAINVMAGKKLETTYPPAGILKVTFKAGPTGLGSMEPAYAIVDGHYYLVATKSTDLGWKGPPDHGLNINAMSTAPGGVSLDVKWNASGVEQEQTCPNGSLGVMGQYVEHVAATSTNNTGTMTLTITDAGHDIYQSQPLAGKGTIEYKRP